MADGLDRHRPANGPAGRRVAFDAADRTVHCPTLHAGPGHDHLRWRRTAWEIALDHFERAHDGKAGWQVDGRVADPQPERGSSQRGQRDQGEPAPGGRAPDDPADDCAPEPGLFSPGPAFPKEWHPAAVGPWSE